jgi:hypothetical protein
VTVRELIQALAGEDPERIVVIGNVRNLPFTVVGIKEVKVGEEGPIYIRAEKK